MHPSRQRPACPTVLVSILLLGLAGCQPDVAVTPAAMPAPARVPATSGSAPARSAQTRPAASTRAVSPEFQGALKARLGDEFAAIVLADGRKTVVPVESLAEGDLEFLRQLAEEQPLVAAGRSSVVVVASTDPRHGPKKTMEVSRVEGPLETVQLCAPNVGRDQIGATCMLYARVHWLDIAGYYVTQADIYKIINDTPPDEPWLAPKYVEGLSSILTGFPTKPKVHEIPPGADAFEWARSELRRGRPILAALPSEIELTLPAEFVIKYPWSGGDVGHQVVVNGFTWNRDTGEGSFHIVNTWAELPEFDLDLKRADEGALIFEASLSPVGEVPTKEEIAAANEFVTDVKLVKAVGSGGLYAVTTNLGVRRVVAPDADAARRMIEEK
jgi:hypothetical protein